MRMRQSVSPWWMGEDSWTRRLWPVPRRPAGEDGEEGEVEVEVGEGWEV